jgi:2-polyprenyl-6-methoxyphenol hydroxylase-like FAD-dependent oxidoreductase
VACNCQLVKCYGYDVSQCLLCLFYLFTCGGLIYPDFKQTRSPTCVAHFSQHRLVPLLLKRLERLGFNICNGNKLSNDRSQSYNSWVGNIRLGHECISINPTSDGIRTTICSVKGESKVRMNLQCNVLIGADGAGSTVRKLMGINMKGEHDIQKLISVHFMSKQLGDFLSKKMPGMLYFVFNPKIIGVVVAHDLCQGEFVLQVSRLEFTTTLFN